MSIWLTLTFTLCCEGFTLLVTPQHPAEEKEWRTNTGTEIQGKQSRESPGAQMKGWKVRCAPLMTREGGSLRTTGQKELCPWWRRDEDAGIRNSGLVDLSTREKCRERCFTTFWYRVNETRADSSEEDMTAMMLGFKGLCEAGVWDWRKRETQMINLRKICRNCWLLENYNWGTRKRKNPIKLEFLWCHWRKWAVWGRNVIFIGFDELSC